MSAYSFFGRSFIAATQWLALCDPSPGVLDLGLILLPHAANLLQRDSKLSGGSQTQAKNALRTPSKRRFLKQKGWKRLGRVWIVGLAAEFLEMLMEKSGAAQQCHESLGP